MPKKKHAPLPEPLKHFQKCVNALSKLPPEERNEDVDSSIYETPLRKRLKGMDKETADRAVLNDLQVLKEWLKSTGGDDHPAYCLMGYLLGHAVYADNAEFVAEPIDPVWRGPMVEIDALAGWKKTVCDGGATLRKGKLIAYILVMESPFDGSESNIGVQPPPDWNGTKVEAELNWGTASGKKRTFAQTAPVLWKRLEYLLWVSGGLVFVCLDSTGKNFQETEIESMLHTLRLVQPASK